MSLRRLVLALLAVDTARQLVRAGYRRGVLDAHTNYARSLDA